MTDEKKLNLNQRLFKGAKGVIEKDPSARWIADKKGMQIQHHLEFLSLCVSIRYNREIDLTQCEWIKQARRNLHEDEIIGFLQEEFGFQVKLGLISSDYFNLMKDKLNQEIEKKDPVDNLKLAEKGDLNGE